MARHAVVVHEFASYRVGQTITDAEEAERLLSGPNRAFVVPSMAADEPAEPFADAPASSDAPEPETPPVDPAGRFGRGFAG